MKSLAYLPAMFDIDGLGTIQARGILAFVETGAHRLPSFLSGPIVPCPQGLQIRERPAALKIPVPVSAKIKSADRPDMIDMPKPIIVPGHTGLEPSLQVFPELGYCIADKLFPQAGLAGPETLADPGPDVIAEFVLGPLVVPFFVLANGEKSQTGRAKSDRFR